MFSAAWSVWMRLASSPNTNFRTDIASRTGRSATHRTSKNYLLKRILTRRSNNNFQMSLTMLLEQRQYRSVRSFKISLQVAATAKG